MISLHRNSHPIFCERKKKSSKIFFEKNCMKINFIFTSKFFIHISIEKWIHRLRYQYSIIREIIFYYIKQHNFFKWQRSVCMCQLTYFPFFPMLNLSEGLYIAWFKYEFSSLIIFKYSVFFKKKERKKSET